MTAPSTAVVPAAPAASTLTVQDLHNLTTVDIFGTPINFYALAILFIFLIFAVAFWKANKTKKLDWSDMISTNGEVSTPKVLQLVGGIAGTFAIVELSLTHLLSEGIFAIYLTYVASVDGFSRFILAKYGIVTGANTPPPVAPPMPAPPAPPPLPPAPAPAPIIEVNQAPAAPPAAPAPAVVVTSPVPVVTTPSTMPPVQTGVPILQTGVPVVTPTGYVPAGSARPPRDDS